MRAARSAGRVNAFDDARGLGEVTSSDGEVLAFHCVEIADGSRSISVGTPVTFVRVCRLGLVEAADVTPC